MVYLIVGYFYDENNKKYIAHYSMCTVIDT